MARRPERFQQNRDLLHQMQQVADKWRDWRPATEVLTEVQAVPTIFPQYDCATRVMGHPIARFCRLHGDSGEGKTTFAIGLMLSFLRKGHFAAFADAERTTPPKWLAELMGEHVRHPGFRALPVQSYEQTVDAVREFCEGVAEARAKGALPEKTSGVIVIDSIRKLQPKNLLKELLTKGTKDKGVDGFGGRAGQIKAALNAAWVDELVPLLAATGMAMLIIARETDDPDAGFYEEGIKVGGGKALYYDSSLDIRVSRKYITDDADHKRLLGERHRVEIRKTKIGKKESKYPTAFFHTSNGVEETAPPGFDRARDVLELAIAEAVVQQAGSSYRYEGLTLGRGEAGALRHLRQHAELMAEMEMKARHSAAAKW